MYQIVSTKNGQIRVLATEISTLEEARQTLASYMAEDDHGGDIKYIGSEEARANELGMLNDIANDGVDVSADIAKVTSWTVPCLVDQNSLEEVCNMADDTYSYDGHTYTIVYVPDQIKEHLEAMCDTPCEIEVLDTQTLGDAVYAKFTFDGDPQACIYYPQDDILFTPTDWQSGYPATKDEIENYSWVSQDGEEAIVINGLPRLFAAVKSERNRLLGRKVAELRRDRGLSQMQLAKRAGLKQEAVSRIESGRYGATLDTITRLSAALGEDL